MTRDELEKVHFHGARFFDLIAELIRQRNGDEIDEIEAVDRLSTGEGESLTALDEYSVKYRSAEGESRRIQISLGQVQSSKKGNYVPGAIFLATVGRALYWARRLNGDKRRS